MKYQAHHPCIGPRHALLPPPGHWLLPGHWPLLINVDGQAEISELDDTRRSQEDVLQLDVSMDNTLRESKAAGICGTAVVSLLGKKQAINK